MPSAWATAPTERKGGGASVVQRCKVEVSVIEPNDQATSDRLKAPPSADLAVEAKPIMPAEGVRSEAAGIAHDMPVEGWGERRWAAVARLCHWAADNGMKGLDCPPLDGPQLR